MLRLPWFLVIGAILVARAQGGFGKEEMMARIVITLPVPYAIGTASDGLFAFAGLRER
jgi:hypothetical protein